MSVPMQSEHIHVRVTFPITKTGPYNAEVLPQTTVGVVLAAAMDHFKVHNDSQFSYVLTYGGVQQPDSVTLGSLANGAHDMVFALVKKLTQGSTTTLDLESERNLDNDEGVVAEFLDQRGGSLKRDGFDSRFSSNRRRLRSCDLPTLRQGSRRSDDGNSTGFVAVFTKSSRLPAPRGCSFPSLD